MAREIDPALLAELQRRGIVPGRHAVSEGTKSGQRSAGPANGTFADMPLDTGALDLAGISIPTGDATPPGAPPAIAPDVAAGLKARGIEVPGYVPPTAAGPVSLPADRRTMQPPPITAAPVIISDKEAKAFGGAKNTNVEFEKPKVEGDFAKPPGGEGTQGAPGAGAPASNWSPPAGKVSPEHWQKTISPETQTLYNQYFAKQEHSNATAAKAALESNEALAKAEENQAQRIGEDRLNSAMRDAVNKDALDRQFADYKQLQQDAAEQKIDPGRWWGSKSGAEKALGVIAMALGAAGQGLTHGRMPNMAAQLIERAVDRDIDAQKSEMQGKAHAAEIAGNLYSMKLRQFGDERTADAAARAQMYEQYRLQMHAEAMRAQSPTLQAAAEQADAMLAAKQAEYHRGIEKYVAAQKVGGLTEKDFARAAEIYKDAAANGKPMTETQALQAAVALRGGAPNTGVDVTKQKSGAEATTVNLPSGGTAEALSPKAAEEFTLRTQGAQEAIEGLNEIVAIRKAAGGGTLSPEQRGRAEAAAARVKLAVPPAAGYNRPPSEQESKSIDKFIPAEGGAFSLDTDAKLRDAISYYRKVAEAAHKTYLKGGGGSAGEDVSKFVKPVE